MIERGHLDPNPAMILPCATCTDTIRESMDTLGPVGKPPANGGLGSAGRGAERLVVDGNGNASPRDHPMLVQTNPEVKTKTHYPYKEPRIDQRMYQAEIPMLQGGDSNRAVTRGSLSPRAGESKFAMCSVNTCAIGRV